MANKAVTSQHHENRIPKLSDSYLACSRHTLKNLNVSKWPTAGDHERLLRRSETQKTILGHAAALERGVCLVRVD